MRWTRSIERKLLLFALGAALGTAATVFTFAETADLAVDRQTQNAAKAEESSRRIEAEHDCRKLAGFELLYCSDQTARRAHDAERQDYETGANQKQAIWTKAAGMAAGAALFFNLVTILVILFSYVEQRVANRQAREEFLHARHEAEVAAADRDRQLRHQDLTTRAQLRCYFNSKHEICKYDPAGTTLTLEYIYKNVGLTPAHDVMFSLSANFAPFGDGKSDIRDLGKHEFPYGEVGPKTTNQAPMTCNLKAAEAVAIEAGKGIIYVVASIRYRDEFGDTWMFTQSMQVDRHSEASGVMYTNKCETLKLALQDEQQENEELPLKGGHEGKGEHGSAPA
jgi:hypothetical protein